MLNISHNTIKDKEGVASMNSFKILEQRNIRRKLIKILYMMGAIGIVILFLPWTQNIRSHARVTALKPNQRPQTIHSIIAGRIE